MRRSFFPQGIAVATTFNVIFLGTAADLDPTEGNSFAENGNALEGLTYGSIGSPLHNNVRSFSPGTGGFAGGETLRYDTDNTSSSENFKLDGGADQVFDSVFVYDSTVTYTDGTTDTLRTVLFQDTAGNVYLAPQMSQNSDQDALEAKPIRSLTLDTYQFDSQGLVADRVGGAFLEPDGVVDGTAGDDTMTVGYTDADGDAVTSDDDSISGGAGNDSIDAGGGNDTVSAGAGNDTVQGGDGRDHLTGNTGTNFLYGGDGDDTFVGGTGTDSLFGGSGLDVVDYSASNSAVEIDLTADTATGGHATGDVLWGVDGIIGSAFNDTLIGFDSSAADYTNYFDGGAGDDFIDGMGSDDTLFGGSGNDSVVAGSGNDTIYGGAGNDALDGGAGTDDLVVYGGSHTEYTYAIDGSGNLLITEIASGDVDTLSSVERIEFIEGTFDLVVGTNGDDGLGPPDTDAIFVVAGDGTNNVGGSDNADIYYGGDSTDFVGTGDGNDTIYGGGGNDTIDGGGNSDTIFAGAGDDTILGNFGVTETFDGGTGFDTVIITGTDVAAFSYDINLTTGSDQYGRTYVSIENVYGSDTDDVLTGNTANNTLSGEGGDDTLFGGSGSDNLIGGDGNDTLRSGNIGGDGQTDRMFGGAGDDVFIGDDDLDYMEGGSGNDSFVGGDGADQIYAGSGNDTIDAGDGNDVLIRGNDGDDLINLGSGNDEAQGNDGSDTVFGGAGNDRIGAGNDEDTIFGGSGNDLLGGEAGNDEVFGDSGDDTLFGGFGADALFGGDGADTLFGDDGNDTISGGAGNDTLTLGAGDDTAALSRYGGDDVITDFDIGDTDSDGFTNDQLDVSSLRDLGGDPVNVDDVTVTDNGSGFAKLSFPEGESIVLQGVPVASMSSRAQLVSAGIPCFTAGTPILTPRGPVMVESLRAGDLVMTRDNGLQPIVWAGQRTLGRKDLLAMPKLRPVRVAAGTFGNEDPILFSPQHGLLLQDKGGGVPETFVRARHLARIKGGKVRVAHGVSAVTYVHLMFESHQVVMSGGIWSESFYPGPQAMASLRNAEAAELATLFPALATDKTDAGYGLQARNFAAFCGLAPHLSALAPVAD